MKNGVGKREQKKWNASAGARKCSASPIAMCSGKPAVAYAGITPRNECTAVGDRSAASSKNYRKANETTNHQQGWFVQSPLSQQETSQSYTPMYL